MSFDRMAKGHPINGLVDLLPSNWDKLGLSSPPRKFKLGEG
jgi:hypothetical protein